ncbi:hydrogenase maturation protease [Candidatus Leptofilum sp.]|uniref:hydrogenase maturation protease n=1 Tax=Candidatus Leptofilum sp. TaxID=3241576 RepID=UPI003B5AB0F4
MQKTVVIGIGNPLRGDDGVGWAVIEALREEAVDNITAVSIHQLLPELIDQFREEAQVIFVDASIGGEPGDVTVTAVDPKMDESMASHHLDPGVLVALGIKLYGCMPPAHLVAIAGYDFGYHERLSEPVAQAVATAVCQIKQLAGIPIVAP